MVSGRDTAWSVPGTTAGLRERYQSRDFRGLFLTAGSNGMDWHEGKPFFVEPERFTPWRVLAHLPDPYLGGRLQWKQVAGGDSPSQADARKAAERAALEYLKNSGAQS